MLGQPVLDVKIAHSPFIIYRPILPSDLDVLERVHAALFPIRYEREFFLNVVRGNGIVSWAAVYVGRNSQSNEIVGFVTTRIITAHESEVEDFLKHDASRKDQTLVYILTLGVVEHYRNLGIASSLVQEVIKYASSIASCRGVYLHVIAYNQPAISFYEKMQFKLVRRLHRFYYITGQHYDAYLFLYYVNGGKSPCSPLLQWYAHTFDYAEASWQQLRHTLGAYLNHWLPSCGRMRKRKAQDGQTVKRATLCWSCRTRGSSFLRAQQATAFDNAREGASLINDSTTFSCLAPL